MSSRPRRLRTLGVIALIAALSAPMLSFVAQAPARAAVTAGPINSSGPLTRIAMTPELACQVDYAGVRQFYSDHSCYTTVASDGFTSGIEGWGDPWTPDTQTLSGTGTKTDPYVLTTSGHGHDWSVTQRDTYVTGQGDYASTLTVVNAADRDREGVVTHAADCYLQGGDFGYGAGDPDVGSVTCLKNRPSSADPGQVESFIPRTPGGTFMYGPYGDVFAQVRHGAVPGNRMLIAASTEVDNGMAIGWEASFAAGESKTFAWSNHFSTGEDPGAEATGELTLDDTDGNGRPDAGETVSLALTVENTGTVTLADGTVTDSLGLTVPCAGPITPGETVRCASSSSHELTQAEIDSGALTDRVEFSAVTPRGTSFTAEPVDLPLALSRSGSGTTSVTAAGGAGLGEDIAVTTRVENTGNVTLHDVAASVDGGAASCPGSDLAPGQTMDCTVAHTVTQDEVDAGSVLLRAAGTATDPTGTALTLAASETTVPLAQDAALAATFTPVVSGGLPGVGDAVTGRITVSNTGTVSVSSLVVEFDGGELTAACPAASIAPGASLDCDVDGAHTVTQADVDHGSVAFRATVSGTAPTGAAVSAEVTAAQETAAQAPSLSTTVVPALHSAGHAPAVGDQTDAVVTVSNTGNVTLHDVSGTVTAPSGVTVSCPVQVLAPGGSTDCATSGHVLSQEDLDAGSVDFAVRTTAVGPDGQDVDTSDTASLPVERAQALLVTGTASLSTDGAPHAGAQVDLGLRVRNTGNVTVRDLRGTVRGSDLAVTCDSDTVRPGDEVECVVEGHRLTQDEIDAGRVGFDFDVDATAAGGTTVTATDRTEVAIPRAADIAVTATSVLQANEHEYPLAGDRAEVSLHVRNTGNVSLSDLAATVAEHGGLTVTCSDSALEPGAATDCAVSPYALRQADVDRGSVRFAVDATATGAGTGTLTGRAETSLSIVRASALHVTAAASLAADAKDPTAAGDHVSVRVAVRNDGNTTLSALTGSLQGADGQIVCPSGPLAPGATVDCDVLDQVLTQQQVDAGGARFELAVTGTGPDSAVSSGDAAEVAIDRRSAITVSVGAHLAASEHRVPQTGDTIVIPVVVTNSGNVTVSDPVVEVPELAGVDPDCPAGAIAPGASIDCSVQPYAITQSDIDAGAVTVAATAEALAVDDSHPAAAGRVTVRLDGEGALDLQAQITTKTGATGAASELKDGAVLHPGDLVTVSATVVNTGNLAVHELQSVTAGVGPLQCEADSLLPGDRTTCAAPDRKITQSDVQPGATSITIALKGSVARADGATDAEESSSDIGQVSTRNVAADGVDVHRAQQWIFSNEVTRSFTIAASPIELAFTGSTVLVALPFGIGLLVLGFLLLVLLRRRGNRRES